VVSRAVDDVAIVDGRFCPGDEYIRKFARSCSKDWAFPAAEWKQPGTVCYSIVPA
jgi:hypothetical protein